MKSSSTGSSKYFDAQLTDGSKQRRIVGFDAKVRQKLSDFHEREEAVVMSNCVVKLNIVLTWR